MKRPTFLHALFVLLLATVFAFTMRPLSASHGAEQQPPAPPAYIPAGQTPRSPDIVGGQEATPGAWPWQVALLYSSSNAQFCGGSIIAADWVLTAAHCVDGRTTSQLYIVAGIHDLVAPDPGHQQRTLSQIIIHPDWDKVTYDNDIALLKLSSPINERPGSGGGVLPIAYIDLVPADIGALTGANVTVTGWGNRATAPGDKDNPARLHEVTVPVVSNAICAMAYSPIYPITANMLCASVLGSKDACQGDSGGPLVYNNNSAWQLAGITSWGIGCAHPTYYGVYARVSVLTDWVKSYTSPLVPTDYLYLPLSLNK